MKSPEEIVGLLTERESTLEPGFARMRRVRAAYDGDIVVPLPELDQHEQVSVANLLAQGLDQTAMRVASVLPDVMMPPARDDVKSAEKRARTRRNAVLGWWQHNRMDIKLSKRARHLLGYACSPVSLRFDPRTGVPEWMVRDPLTTFPAPLHGPDDLEPYDTIFTYERTFDWVKDRWPEAAERLRHRDTRGSDLLQLVEYCDAVETVLLAVGKPEGDAAWHRHADYSPPVVELERTVNRAGVCPVVIAGRVNGVLKGGELRDSVGNPGFMTNPTIDRLERAQRVTAGIPPEFGGESGSNIRTGRRGEAVLSAVVDFPVQEAQRMISASMEVENKRAIALMKAYAGNKTHSFYVSMKGAKGPVEYTPNKDFDSDENRVVFSHPGSDVNDLVIGAGQRIGMGTMSKRSFMAIDPMVDDAESEHDAVVAEGLEQALLASIQTQASQGQIPPADLARIAELVRTDRAELAKAVQKVQEEAQERQASEVPAGSPELMPGIAQPGAGAAAQPAGSAEAGPPPLRDLLAQVG